MPQGGIRGKQFRRLGGLEPRIDARVTYANVEIPFVKDIGNIHGVKGRSVHVDGSVVPFDGKVMEQTIVKAKGLKYLAKTFTLPDVQVGGIIEYHYTHDLTKVTYTTPNGF